MKNIILTKRDLVENILTSTEDLGISKLLTEFLTYGKNNCDNVFSLYLCIEKLDSPMLANVPSTISSRKELYKTLKQVLYVSGKWSALVDFYFFMNFRGITANQFTVTTVCETNRFNIADKDMLMYYKAYIKIYSNWEDIVDRMDVTTLSSIYPRLKKYPKNILKLLQIYCHSDIIYSIEIVKTYGADVGKLLLEY